MRIMSLMRSTLFGLLVVLGATSALKAQRPRKQAADGVPVGSNFGGVTLGVGAIGSANFAFGARFEHIFAAVPSMDNGKLGIGLAADYYGWSGPGYSFSYKPVGATLNYHFSMDEPSLDPFVGLGVGYSIVSFSGLGSANSSAYAIARLGFRYFMTKAWSVQVDGGTGSSMGNVGLMLHF